MNRHPDIDVLLRAGMAENTRRAYGRDLDYFWAWAENDPFYPVPVDLLRLFAMEHTQGLPEGAEKRLVSAGLKRPGVHTVETVRRRMNALAWAHRERGLTSPTRDDQLRGILAAARRVASQAGRRRKKSRPITKAILDRMLAVIDGRTLHGIRARAILEFGFYTGGRRRSEISGALMRHLTPHGRGFYYLLHRSKTDQDGKGRLKLLRSEHAGGLRRWLRRTGITRGYIFRSIGRGGVVKDSPIDPGEVNRTVKRYLDIAGIDPAGYSAHGLRRGFVSYCGRKGIPLQDVMRLTDHRRFDQVLEYYEEGAIERNPATLI